MSNPLSDKQTMFCNEYLKDFNATQAAIRAGYSKKTACEQASRLLVNVNVQKYLNSRKVKITQKLEITQERTMKEIARLAFSDIRCLFNEDGSLKAITDLTEEESTVLASVETDELFDGYGKDREKIGLTKKVKLWDKTKALEMLAKHFNIYSDAPNTTAKIIIKKKNAST